MKHLLLLLLAGCFLSQGCESGNASFDYRTRDLIDSLTNKENALTTIAVEKYCKDSFDKMVQRAVDSLIIVREQEIQKTIDGK